MSSGKSMVMTAFSPNTRPCSAPHTRDAPTQQLVVVAHRLQHSNTHGGLRRATAQRTAACMHACMRAGCCQGLQLQLLSRWGFGAPVSGSRAAAHNGSGRTANADPERTEGPLAPHASSSGIGRQAQGLDPRSCLPTPHL